jgi:hypothetical protein
MAAAAEKASAETELPTLVRMIGNAFDWPEEQVNAAAGACQNGLPGLADYLAGPQKAAQAPDETAGQTDPGIDASVDTAAAFGPRKKEREPDRQSKQTNRRGKRNLRMVLFAALQLLIIVWSCAALLGLWPASRNYILPVLSVLALADLCLFLHSRRQNRPGNSSIVNERTAAGQPAEHKNLWDKLLQAADMGSDTTTGDEDRTVLLAPSESGFRMAMLCEGQPGTAAEHEGIRAFILVDEFIIGRDPKKADLCLPDQAVGRTHARIVRRAGSFFICDLGSGNGTQVDGRRLQKHEESLLPDRCLLQFADRAFYFQAD